MDKRMTPDEVVAELADGMTVGIGGGVPGVSRWHWCGRSCAPRSRTSPSRPTAAPTSACCFEGEDPATRFRFRHA
jgi:hypothetical protein